MDVGRDDPALGDSESPLPLLPPIRRLLKFVGSPPKFVFPFICHCVAKLRLARRRNNIPLLHPRLTRAPVATT